MSDFDPEYIHIPNAGEGGFQSLDYVNGDTGRLPQPKDDITRRELWYAVKASVDAEDRPTFFNEGRIVHETAGSLNRKPYSSDTYRRLVGEAKFALQRLRADRLIVPAPQLRIDGDDMPSFNTTIRTPGGQLYTPQRVLSGFGLQISAASARQAIMSPESSPARLDTAQDVYRIAARQLLMATTKGKLIEPLPINL